MAALFWSLLAKLFPLYATMGAGAALSRKAGNLTSQLAVLQIYLIAPVIIFAKLLRLEMVPAYTALPVLFLVLSALVSGAVYCAARKIAPSFAPIMGQTSGAANLGYLGVPVALILFPPEWMPVYFFTLLGGFFYESTIGYYWVARGAYNMRDAFISLLKLPTFHAILLGLAGNAMDFHLPESWEGIARDFLGAYVVLGSLIIGFAIAQTGKLVIHWGFLLALLVVKYLLWPALMFGCLALLRSLGLGLPVEGEHILLLFSILPMAANSAAFAALLNVHPEETATAVVISTLLGLFVIPAYALLFGLS